MKLQLLTEGILGDMFKNFIFNLKSDVQDKNNVKKRYPQIIAAAEATTVPLLSSHPDALEWWDRLLNTFKVPQQYRQATLKKLVTSIKPHIPSEEDDLEEIARKTLERQMAQDQNKGRGRRRRDRDFHENTAYDRLRGKQKASKGYQNPATPFDFKNFDSMTNRFLDVIVNNKKTVNAYIIRSRNKNIAILACNMLVMINPQQTQNIANQKPGMINRP